MKKVVEYDPEADALAISIKGKYNSTYEVYPGVNVDMDTKGRPICIEILDATLVLRGLIKTASKHANGNNELTLKNGSSTRRQQK